MVPESNTRETACNNAPDKTNIDLIVKQIMSLPSSKQRRLLKIIVDGNYISKEVMREVCRWK